MNNLTEEEELELALVLSAEEARGEQEARDRQLASQLSDENEALRYREVASSRADVGLSPQEAAAFAAYARCEKSNNYGKKKRN